MRIQTETRSLPTELTAEELAVESQKLAAAVEDVARQEENIAEQSAAWKEKKKGLEGYLAHLKLQMNELAAVVDTGMADRDVECSWLYALPHGYAFLVRDDTGKLVTHRKLGEQERQTEILEVIREPTEEQLAAWMESLGLVVDPQADLPLGEPAGPVHYYKTIPFADGSKLFGRFTEADHRPSSLDGVQTSGDVTTGLPEPTNKAELDYETDPGILQDYRRELEDILRAKTADAVAKNRAGGDPTVAERMGIVPDVSPTPGGRGRKGR